MAYSLEAFSQFFDPQGGQIDTKWGFIRSLKFRSRRNAPQTWETRLLSNAAPHHHSTTSLGIPPPSTGPVYYTTNNGTCLNRSQQRQDLVRSQCCRGQVCRREAEALASRGRKAIQNPHRRRRTNRPLCPRQGTRARHRSRHVHSCWRRFWGSYGRREACRKGNHRRQDPRQGRGLWRHL